MNFPHFSLMFLRASKWIQMCFQQLCQMMCKNKAIHKWLSSLDSVLFERWHLLSFPGFSTLGLLQKKVQQVQITLSQSFHLTARDGCHVTNYCLPESLKIRLGAWVTVQQIGCSPCMQPTPDKDFDLQQPHRIPYALPSIVLEHTHKISIGFYHSLCST